MKIRAWKERPAVASIPLREAVICEDCQSVTATKNSKCSVCGSSAVWQLSTLTQHSRIDEIAEKLLRTC